MQDPSVKIGHHTIKYSSIFDVIFRGQRELKIAPFNRKISGPKELKDIINIYRDIRNIFEKRILDTENGVQYMNNTKQSNEGVDLYNKQHFIKKRAAIDDCLNQLEILRKRFINNRQQRKTTHNQNIRLLRELRKLLPPATFSEFGGGFSLEEDPQNTHKSVLMLKHMSHTSKEYHHSTARYILNDINHIIMNVIPKLTIDLNVVIEAIIHELTYTKLKY